jgi:hypothetical protein
MMRRVVITFISNCCHHTINWVMRTSPCPIELDMICRLHPPFSTCVCTFWNQYISSPVGKSYPIKSPSPKLLRWSYIDRIRRFNVFINRHVNVSKIGITGIVDSIIQLGQNRDIRWQSNAKWINHDGNIGSLLPSCSPIRPVNILKGDPGGYSAKDLCRKVVLES